MTAPTADRRRRSFSWGVVAVIAGGCLAAALLTVLYISLLVRLNDEHAENVRMHSSIDTLSTQIEGLGATPAVDANGGARNGENGAQGEQGRDGRDGRDGRNGTDIQGVPGLPGAPSEVAGPQGIPGLPGADSTVAGPAGPPGESVAGPQGEKGDTGAIGSTGLPPASFTFTVSGSSVTCVLQSDAVSYECTTSSGA